MRAQNPSLGIAIQGDVDQVGLLGLCRSVVANLGSPDVLGLQLPEALTSTSSGEGFWKLQSKNV